MRTRSELLKQVADTKRQIQRADNIIAAQRRLVDSMIVQAQDAMGAVNLLTSFEVSQEIRLAEMERLLNMLDRIPKGREAA